MIDKTQHNIVQLIARAASWLAPIPSAWFVGQASYARLEVPAPVAVVVALVVELQGLALTHTALDFYRWNRDYQNRAKKWQAPTWIPVAMFGLYLAVTLALTVVLKVVPPLATYAPGIFPLLALTGTINLALGASHAQLKRDREAEILREAKEKEAKRKARGEKKRAGICRICKEDGDPARLQEGLCRNCTRSVEGESHALPLDLSLAVLKRDDWQCYYCGADLREVPAGERQIDHFVPVSKGGEDVAENLVTSCQACNLRKTDIMPSETRLWEFEQYRFAKIAGPDKKSQILALLNTEDNGGRLKQTDIARILKTSQGYVSSIAREYSDNGKEDTNIGHDGLEDG